MKCLASHGMLMQVLRFGPVRWIGSIPVATCLTNRFHANSPVPRLLHTSYLAFDDSEDSPSLEMTISLLYTLV